MAAAPRTVNQDCLDCIAEYAVDGSAEFMMWRTVSKSWASAAHRSVISAARQDNGRFGFDPRAFSIPRPLAAKVPDWILAAWDMCCKKDHDCELMRTARAGQVLLLIVKSDEMPAVSAQLRASNQERALRCLAIAVRNSDALIVSLNVKSSELRALERLDPTMTAKLRGLMIRKG